MLSAQDLIDNAESLVPVLRDRATECEKLRHCPPESIDDMVTAGLLRICQPARYGGYEQGWDVLCEVGQILSRGCASQAWVNHILNDHVHLLGIFPDQAQRDVWGDSPDVRVSASLDPVGTARRVPGGVIYSGRHRYASGIDHAQWLFCGGRIEGDEKPQRRWFFLLPSSDAVITDDWYVFGLAGTGSKSFEVKEVFIPEHRFMDSELSSTGRGLGREVNPAPVFRLPRGDFASTGTAAIVVGIAEGFLADYLDFTKTRRSHAGIAAQMQSIQIGAGHAAAEIEAASGLYINKVREAMARIESGKTLSRRDLKHTKLCSSYACQLALAAVQRLFNTAGASALFTGNVMQRHLRDIYAAAAHHSMAWDVAAGNWGACLLDVDGTA